MFAIGELSRRDEPRLSPVSVFGQKSKSGFSNWKNLELGLTD